MNLQEFNGNTVVTLENEEFLNTVENIYKLQGVQPDTTDSDVVFAIAGFFVIGEAEIPVIFANEDEMSQMNPDWQTMILTHECAHCEGITDEEEADKWALDRLTDTQQDILKSLWKDRHGYNYGE